MSTKAKKSVDASVTTAKMANDLKTQPRLALSFLVTFCAIIHAYIKDGQG